MSEQAFRFNDGAGYERGMGAWSRLAGDVFLDWLAPPPGLDWIDVGCGNGVFTERIVERCAPGAVAGIDPSEGQLAFARERPAARLAEFRQGGAEALPFPDDSFDVAVMALVIFFVPNPAKGVAEMARVARPGGLVASYSWDLFGGGFPLHPLRAELAAMGQTPPLPPSAEASRIEGLRDLWTGAGLEAVETRKIAVERTFAGFDELWTASTGTSLAPLIAKMSDSDVERLKERLRARLPADAAGRITYGALANAIRARVPE